MEPNLPIIAVGIPTFNRKAFLRESLTSVLAQNYRHLRVIISDNGSQDGTKEMIGEMAAADSRIVYHRFDKNYGPTENVKYLLRNLEGEFIALLPDDDLWEGGHLDAAMSAFRKYPSATMYACRAKYFGIRDETIVGPRWIEDAAGISLFNAKQDFAPWLFGNPFAIACVVFRREALSVFPHYEDNSFGCGDWLLWGKMALLGAAVCDPAIRVRYRWHTGNDNYKTLVGRRWAAQTRYVIRELATAALQQNRLNLPALVKEVADTWPEPEAAKVVLSLSSLDSNRLLRRAAMEIFNRRKLQQQWISSGHCRMAARIGPYYLAIADIIDRIIGRWWRPRNGS